MIKTPNYYMIKIRNYYKSKTRSYYRLQRGSYMQPAFEKKDIRFLIYATLLQVSGRIYDYMTPPSPGAEVATPQTSLEMAEMVYPLRVWGSFFALGAAFLIIGLIQKRHLIVWLGHATLTATYVVLFIALFISTIVYTPLDNYRVFTVLIVPLTLQNLLMMRTGPKPVNPAKIKSTELVGGEGGAAICSDDGD